MVTPQETIFDPGWFRLPRSSHIFHDWAWKQHGHGYVNIERAIAISCDIYFYTLAHKIGIKNIDRTLEQFGFGKPTGVDINEELSGTVASPLWKRRVKGVSWYEGDTINSGIGQGYMQATPLQMAQAVSILANRGTHITPHFLKMKEIPGHSVQPVLFPNADPVILKNNDHWQTVINAMQNVVLSPEGTGYRAFRKVPYTVAGKTGTAQVFSKKHTPNESDDQNLLPEHLRNHSLFVAFAPVDQPKIAIAVVVENSSEAVTIARTLLDYYLLDPKNKP
jgi:penicillin-binding protein 2